MSDTSLVFNVLAKDKASKTFDKIKGAALVAGVAIGAALANGLASAFEKEKAADRLAAQIGDAPWASAAGKAAGDLYANAFGESMQETGDAVRAAMQSGLLGGKASSKEIEDLTGKAISLSQAFDQDVTATSRAAAQMIRTGLAKDGAQALDILTKGFQATGDVAGDLLDTYSEYSTKFRDLGLGGAQAMGLLAQGTRAGARDIDTVADALKEFSIRAIDGSTTSAQGFKMLGLDAKKMTRTIGMGGEYANEGLALVLEKLRGMKDPVKQNAAAVALFGTKAEDLGNALFALNPETAVDALGKVNGAAGELATTLSDNAATKLETFKRKAQAALVEQLAKALPYIESTFGFLAKHSDIVVPLAVALTSLVGVIYAITTAMKIWSAVQVILNLALWTSPITWIVLGIIALVAVIVLIATKTTWFQDAWRVAWGWIKSAAAAVWNWISGTLWPGLKAVFIKIGEIVTLPARKAIEWGAKLISWAKALPGAMVSAFKTMSNAIMSPFKSAFNGIARFWNNTVGSLSFSVPSWVPLIGGKGWSVPDIPMLAKGGIVTGPTLALLGEGGHPERVQPLDGSEKQGGEVCLVLDVRGADEDLKRLVLKWLRSDPGFRRTVTGYVTPATGR